MSGQAEGSQYFSAVQHLRDLITELQELAEQRFGMQRDPRRLWGLLDAVSQSLRIVRATCTDTTTADAARDRELEFDEIVDPIFDHIERRYDDAIKDSAAWATCRRNLRAELDNLDSWASCLLVAVCFLAGGLYEDGAGTDRQAG